MAFETAPIIVRRARASPLSLALHSPAGATSAASTTAQIGEAVMHGLKAFDHVAYIRFASAYKDFTEPGDFAEIAEAVGEIEG